MSSLTSLLAWNTKNSPSKSSTLSSNSNAPNDEAKQLDDNGCFTTGPPPGYIGYVPPPAAGSLVGFSKAEKYNEELEFFFRPKKRSEGRHKIQFLAERPYGVDPTELSKTERKIQSGKGISKPLSELIADKQGQGQDLQKQTTPQVAIGQEKVKTSTSNSINANTGNQLKQKSLAEMLQQVKM